MIPRFQRRIPAAGRRHWPAAWLLAGAAFLLAAVPATAQNQLQVSTHMDPVEGGGAVGGGIVLVKVRMHPSSESTEVTLILGGTATKGTDYRIDTETLTFTPDTLSGTTNLRIIDDSVIDPGETITIRAASPELRDSNQVTLTITDNDAPAPTSLTLSASPPPAEGGGDVTVTASLNIPAPVGGTRVTLTAGGTATNGDYTLSPTSFTIAEGQRRGTATIRVIDDTDDDDGETIELDATSTHPPLSAKQLTLTIADNDEKAASPDRGTVRFVSDSYRVKEPTWMAAWRPLVLQVVRSGDTSAAAEGITAMPAPGTADDWDFVAARTPLRFEAGSDTAKFEIMARDDPFFEDEETFTIALSADAGSGYRVGSPSTATVTIVDGTIAVRFSQDAYTVTEGGNAEVTINLSTSADVPAPLQVSVADSTAIRGSDYSGPETITVTIPAGDTSKTFSVPITDDSDVEQPETFTVTLKPAPNLREYYLRAPSAATITIKDNDGSLQQRTDPLTGSFEEVPAEHGGGNKTFTFLVRFSEPLGTGGRMPSPSSFEVTRGRVQSVTQVEGGLWRVRVKPSSRRTVKVTLAGGRDCDAAGAVCTPDGRALENTSSATVLGLAGLKVAGGKAREGVDEAIDFAVTLSRAATGTVTVDYATEDRTATAGTDYTAASGTLTFAPGETEKTVRVAILDDLIDEGRETFRLKLSNAVGARIADGRATGRIGNTDPGQAAWLSRFGRAVAAGAVDAVGDRIDRRAQVRSSRGDADLSLLNSFLLSAAGGHGAAGMGGAGYGTAGYGASVGGTGAGYPNGMAGPSNGMPGYQNGVGAPMGGAAAGGPLLGNGMPMGPAGAGGDVALPFGSLYVPGGDDGRWTGWAQTSVGHFGSAGPGAALALSGQMRMGIFGADYQMGRLLAGVAVAHGRGAGSMTRAGLDRSYSAHSTLTSVHPYVAFDLWEDLTLWGQSGWGRGEMALAESIVRVDGSDQAGAYRTGNGLSMAAVGVRGGLPEVGGFALAVKSDAFLVRTASDAVASRRSGNLAAAEAGVSRVRAALEGSRELRFAGGRSITPSVELGVRQDGGDAETGTGLETGFGVVYADPGLGLMVDAALHLLVAHQDSRYQEWGFTGSVRFDPGLAGRGLSLTMTPSLGSASQGANRLWGMQDMGGLVPYGGMPFDMGGQLAADVGYGMTGPGSRGTGTPYAGLVSSAMGYRTLRYGWRWTVDRRFDVGVEGARQGGFGGMVDRLGGGPGLGRTGEAAHSVQMRGGVTF